MNPLPAELYGRPWGYREYVLALDVYFRTTDDPRNENTPQIIALAERLRRTVASICMRMENFASLDPGARLHRKGLMNIAPVGVKVFREWAYRPDHLRAAAEALIIHDDSADPMQIGLFDPSPVCIPKAFKKYELMDLLGQGGFGAVYSCVNVETEKLFAIKIISTDRLTEVEILPRFVREIRALREINHANVISLCEDNLDTERHFPAYIMDLAQSSLTDYIRAQHAERTTLPVLPNEVGVKILRSMTSAVRALHSHSPCVIHRDLNPNNILLLPNGEWVLADFGLAKFIRPAPVTTAFQTMTHEGWATGYYSAPEQYRDFKNTDERTDIYALGMLVWELFSRIGPPPERSHSGLGSRLEEVFQKATARNPSDRYVTVEAFIEAFEGAVAAGPLAE